jgi:GEVED domain/Secretion system C-terminal sorting domain
LITCTNGGASATSVPVFVDTKPFLQCYCNTNLGGSCSPNANNIALNSLSNPSTLCNNVGGQAYTIFPDTGSLTTTLLKGGTYPLSMNVASGPALQITAFIDYNRDGIFNNTTERINVLPYNGSNTQSNFTIPVTIPSNADTGKTGFRIRIRASNFNDACDQLGSGETEDYTITIADGVPCSGAPIAGATQSTDSLVCSNNQFSLSLSGAVTNVAGLTYQWYANGVLIPGDTLPVVSNISQSANTTYTCIVTCAISGLSTTSSGYSVNMDTPANCACIPSFVNGCSGDHIVSVSMNGTINNTGTSCPNSPYYTSFTTPVMSANPGDTTICIFEHGNVYQHYINVWIDYNDDFTFSDAERVITNLSMPDSVIQVSTYFIASNDTLVHKMRVLQNFNTPLANPQSCDTTYSYGETEDYLINISDTVTTVLSLGKPISKSRVFNVKLFPNPTTGVLNYEIPANIKQANITVSDLLGRTLVSRTANNSKSIDLSELKNGTYSVSISLDGKVFQSKVVLNK